MEGDERDPGVDVSHMAVQPGARDTRKCLDPTTFVRVYCHVDLSATNEEGANVICGGVCRVTSSSTA